MRMHTIPQNVTAYEDKIVGMLVGRQFIYLAIAGVVIFVLLSTNIGPIFIRVFFSILIAAFAAAVALYKPNDRDLDGLLMSYVQAIFGPTEWVWRKDEVPLEKLRIITDQISGKPVNTRSTSASPARRDHENLLRVSRFQTFIADKESGMDNDDYEFIEQLNFNEPVPQKAFDAINANVKAPPMLTKQNYAQFKAAAPKVEKLQLPKQPEPVSALAGSSNQLGATITVEGRQQGVRLRSNLKTNRSLSRQLLSSGIITLPVRGERKIDLSDELKTELKDIMGYMQYTDAQQPAPTKPMPSTPLPTPAGQAAATVSPAPNPTPAPAQPVELEPKPAEKAERKRRFSDYDQTTGAPSISQQISMLSQALPDSGINKGSSMSDSTTPNQTTQPTDNNASTPTPNQPAKSKVTYNAKQAKDAMASDSEMEKEAYRIERQTQQALSELEKTMQPNDPQPTNPTDTNQAPPADNSAVLTSQYQEEISRLKAQSAEIQQKVQQAEAALKQLQQQLPDQAATNHPAIGSQQELITKLQQQQAQSEAFVQELEQKLPNSTQQSHVHAEYAPVPQVGPVIAEQPAEISAPPAQPQPTTAPTPTQTLSTPAPQDNSGELDLQAKMAAAGVGSNDQIATPAPQIAGAAPTAQSVAAPNIQQTAVALTNQPNIVNGTVVDAQGQLVPGVVVVVKNAQGEPKRALKTNKLGQFVVTTPLANGVYTVEVDKKGLSFDIMNVELTGTVLTPILIRSKSG